VKLFIILKYIVARLFKSIPTIIGIILLNFLIIQLAPGDPAEALAGESGGATIEYVEELREKLGLNKSGPERFYLYAKSVAVLDLGFSFRNNAPVLDLILDRFGPTFLLMGTALIISICLGTVLGIMSSKKINSLTDNFISVLSVVSYATPVFWVAIMAILIFSIWIPIFPVAGMTNVIAFYDGWDRVIDIAHHLVLPSTTLALFYTAVYARLSRATVIEQRYMDYVTTARAKGLTESQITWRHIFPNAVLPVITMAGVQMGALLGGSVVVETVFAWPGLGTLAYQALFSRDLNLLLGIFVFCTVLVVFVNILVDLMYMLIDPRIKV
jgi:peptide/nickel transport system permease protein